MFRKNGIKKIRSRKINPREINQERVNSGKIGTNDACQGETSRENAK